MKYLILLIILFSSQSVGQNTPAEFAEMSMQQLFNQSIYDVKLYNNQTSPWSLTYQFKTVEFEGYLDGTKRLSFDEVLWNGPSEPRTAKNFPILPTLITQKAQIFALGYQFSPHWHGRISVPYIQQRTDHISIVGNYEYFTIKTQGVGEASILASYKWFDADSDTGVWRFSFGLNLPTGSIDETGDTPREPGEQQLPYTMQLGSGTYDFPFEFSYINTGAHDFNVGLSANIRSGTNDRNYRLGNNYSLHGGYRIDLSPTIQTFVRVNFMYSLPIHGQDDSLLVNSPFPYPAGITNPDLYGGKKINVRLGILWQIAKDYRLSLEIGKPVYQNLNGPQPKEKWQSAVSISRVM
ncbi:MAG: hypothetical protein QMC51_03320 [Alteromonadaceae bacterium]